MICLTRIRNEEDIIIHTLNHMSEFCERIYVFDDASKDYTLRGCQEYPGVAGILQNRIHKKDRIWANSHDRQALYNFAFISELGLRDQVDVVKDWFVYMDADERIEIDWPKATISGCDAITMKLYDYYITEEDKFGSWEDRKYLGPEYREIIMAFKPRSVLGWTKGGLREPVLKDRAIVNRTGYVKHYGKAISIKQFEETCNYYIENFPHFKEKWEKRKGHAIHTKSDFGNELITWDQKEEKGILLTPEMHKKEMGL